MTNEEAIEELKEELEIFKKGISPTDLRNPNPELKIVLEANDMAIKALEQTRWIPVSERLPEESGAYLVWMIWGDEEPTYSIINFDADYNEFGEWIEHYDINTLGVLDREFKTYIDVFAWMPLPQPYKAEKER